MIDALNTLKPSGKFHNSPTEVVPLLTYAIQLHAYRHAVGLVALCGCLPRVIIFESSHESSCDLDVAVKLKPIGKGA